MLCVLFFPRRGLHRIVWRTHNDLYVFAAKPTGRTAAVHCCVSAAENNYGLADLVGMFKRYASKPIYPYVDIRRAFLASGYLQFSATRRAGSDKHRIVIPFEHPLQALDIVIEVSFYAHVEDVIYLFVEHAFGEPKSGDLAQHKPAALSKIVKEIYFVSQRCQISSDRQRGRPGTDQCDLFIIRLERPLWHQ